MNFNHAMVYVHDVARALEFYSRLGLVLIEGSPKFGYARLKFPQGQGTIALHQVEEGQTAAAEGIRLYFEVQNLDEFCNTLAASGVNLKQMPEDMPWGWRHAYLDDPDGHELSLYWAGENRLQSSQG